MSEAIRQKVCSWLIEQIESGVFRPGDRLPTEEVLAEQFETNRSNVHLAMRLLADRGLIERHKRRGSFVTRQALRALDAAPLPVTTQSGRIHVLMRPESPPKMHWNEAAMHRFEEELEAEGLMLIYEDLPDIQQPGAFRCLVDDLVSSGSQGLVMLVDPMFVNRPHPEVVDPELVKPLLDYPGPVVLFNRSGHTLRGWPFHAVNLNPYGDGTQAARLAVQLGVRHVVWLQPADPADWNDLRLLGFSAVLPAELEVHEVLLPPAKESDQLDQLWTVLDGLGEEAVIVAPNDRWAACVLTAAAGEGRRCPEEFQLLSFDNDLAYRRFNLTSIGPPVEEVGELLARAVCGKLQDPPPAGQAAITVESRLYVRMTAVPATRSQ